MLDIWNWIVITFIFNFLQMYSCKMNIAKIIIANLQTKWRGFYYSVCFLFNLWTYITKIFIAVFVNDKISIITFSKWFTSFSFITFWKFNSSNICSGLIISFLNISFTVKSRAYCSSEYCKIFYVSKFKAYRFIFRINRTVNLFSDIFKRRQSSSRLKVCLNCHLF